MAIEDSNGLNILDLESEAKIELKEQLELQEQEKIKEIQRLERRRIEIKKNNYQKGARKRKIRQQLKQEGATEEEIKYRQKRIKLESLKNVDKKIKGIENNKLTLFVDDNFNDPYAINVASSKDADKLGIKILEKTKSKLLELIEKGGDDKVKLETLNKLLNAVNYNLDSVESGDFEEGDAEEGEYPIMIEWVADKIILNFTSKKDRK